MRILVLATLVGLCMSYPMETSKQHKHPTKQHEAGFMSGMDFDGFIQDARLPAMARSADMAEDRQGGAGAGSGFNSPGFNIPFTPNFQFNEFSSPFGNGNSFSQFLSGLGGSSQLATTNDFVEQTEQRFTRPQIGGAQISGPQGGQFKRETPKTYQNQNTQNYQSHQNHQNLKNHQNHQNHQTHQNPSHRYESAQYEQPKRNFKQPESFKRPQPVYTAKKKNDDLPKGNYQQYYSPEVREDTREPVYQKTFDKQTRKQEPVYQKTFDQEARNQEFKVESREAFFDDETFEEVGKSKNLDQMFDQQQSQFPDSDFDLNFEPAKFEPEQKPQESKSNKPSNLKPFTNVGDKYKSKGQQTFSPPSLVEKFNTPVKPNHSIPYPFQVPSNKQEPNPFQASIRQEPEPSKPSNNIKPFTNVEDKYQLRSDLKPTPTFEPLPSFTNFKAEPKDQTFTNFKEETKNPSFTNFKAESKNPSFNNFKAETTIPSFTNFKEETKNPSFSNLKEEPKTPSFNNFKGKPKSPGFTNFKEEPKKSPKQSQPTKKPYQYEKKNFREPLKQVNRNPGPHQLIRIKAKKNQRQQPKQPKQLRQTRPAPRQSGFRPITSSAGFRNNPNPGKLVIEEVVRRKDTYRPEEIQYDNQQPLITLDSVSDGKHFKASNNQDSFAINVKASFQPKPEPQRQRVQKRRGNIHLPTLTLPSRPQKRQRSLVMDEVPYFESSKITRPSSMDTAFVLDTDHFGF